MWRNCRSYGHFNMRVWAIAKKGRKEHSLPFRFIKQIRISLRSRNKTGLMAPLTFLCLWREMCCIWNAPSSLMGMHVRENILSLSGGFFSSFVFYHVNTAFLETGMFEISTSKRWCFTVLHNRSLAWKMQNINLSDKDDETFLILFRASNKCYVYIGH